MGLTGHPVPRAIRSGPMAKRNSQRLATEHCCGQAGERHVVDEMQPHGSDPDLVHGERPFRSTHERHRV